MKINFNRFFKNYKGDETSELMADKVSEALFIAGFGQQLPIDNKDKFLAYKLSQKIINAPGEVEINTEEASLIKSLCVNFFTSGAYGQVEELIEG